MIEKKLKKFGVFLHTHLTPKITLGTMINDIRFLKLPKKRVPI